MASKTVIRPISPKHKEAPDFKKGGKIIHQQPSRENKQLVLSDE